MKSLLYFKALADETRIRLFNILLNHELSVNELVYLMDMGQSRISRHLKIMTDSGLLQCRRDGIWAFYSASKDGIEKEFVEAMRSFFRDDDELSEDLKNATLFINDRSKKSKHFFNRIAHEWDDIQKQIVGDFDLNGTILKCVDPCNFAVDMGCGTGRLLYLLKDFSAFTVGVDSSPVMLEQARKLFKEGNGDIELRLGELEHLPVRDNEADLVIISMALHHLSDPEKAVAEASRILNIKGKFIIADFEKHQKEYMRDKYGDRWLGFSKREIKGFLAGNGFKIINIESFALNQPLKLTIYKSEKK